MGTDVFNKLIDNIASQDGLVLGSQGSVRYEEKKVFSKLIDNIASQDRLAMAFPQIQKIQIFLYKSGIQGATVSMFALLQGCAEVGGFSIRNCPSPPCGVWASLW